MRFLFVIVSPLLMSCVADVPINMEDPAESHGKLDPEAQKRLANPNKTYKELEEEIEENRSRIEELESQINLDQLGIEDKKDSPEGDAKDKEPKNPKTEDKKPKSQEEDSEPADKENKRSSSPNKNTKPENKTSKFNAFDFRMPASSEEPSLFSQLKTRLKALGVTAQTLISRKTRLMLAAENEDIDLVEYFLVDRKADPNEKNKKGYTALMYALWWNPNLEIVRLLLEAGADPNIGKSQGGYTALMYALFKKQPNLEIVRLLLRAGARANTVENQEGYTPLMYALDTEHPNLEIIRLLLRAGADPNRLIMRRRNGVTWGYLKIGSREEIRLKRPVEKELEDLINTIKQKCERLTASGYEPKDNFDDFKNTLVGIHPDNCRTGIKQTLLMDYVGYKFRTDVEVMRFLLDAGVNVNLQDEHKTTALMYAIIWGDRNPNNLEIIRFLLEAGTDVNLQGQLDKTALMLVGEKENQDSEIVRLLLEAGADLSIRGRSHRFSGTRTVLRYFFLEGSNINPDVVRLLLGARTNIGQQGRALREYLDWGSEPEIVRLLLEAGVNLEDVREGLEVHVRGRSLNLEVVRLLLEAVEGSMEGYEYEWVLDKIREGHALHPNIREITNLLDTARKNHLQENDVEKDSKFYSNSEQPVDERCKRLFHLMTGNVDDIKNVLNTGIDPNTCRLKDSDGSAGYTLLMYLAIYNPNPDIMRILLNARADPNIKTEVDEFTALMILVSYNPNIELMELLLDRGADVDATNRYGKTALWFHVKANTDPEVVRFLLEAGADPNAQDEQQGHTVLISHLSSPYHNNITAEIVRLLLEAGADPSIREKQHDRTALAYFNGRRKNWQYLHHQEREILNLLDVERRKERVERWLALSFSERERERMDGRAITQEFAGLRFIFPERDTEIQAIESEDSKTRKNIAQRELVYVKGLTMRQRVEQDIVRKKIESVIVVSELSEELQDQIESINEQDKEFRNQWARSELTKRLEMTYDERSSEEKNLSQLFDLSRLSEDLQNEIQALEAKDAEIAENRRKASLWAARIAREQRLRTALETIRDPTVVSYRQSRVKLWPIRCRNSNNPVYPYTREDRPMSIELRNRLGEGLRVEIGHQQSDEFTLLAEGVRRLELNVEAPRDLYNSENYLNYNISGKKETFRLNNLIDIAETKSVSYLRVLPSDSEHSVEVSWRGVRNRSFKGEFRIEITDRRSSNRSEWSVINELPIEWYIQSVTSSEMPSSYTLDALKAQAVAARSYFLNRALEDRNVQARGWDIDPTQCNQVYKGSGERSFSSRRNEQVNIAVAETTGLVLTHNGRLAQTQYYACGTEQTKRGSNFIERSRNIPSEITCSRYSRRLINHHGYGMPQFAANYLTKNGWPRSNDNSPTEEAKVPDNIREPWEWIDVLNYFYRGESPKVKVQDFRQL